MSEFLIASTSTNPSVVINLPHGTWKISLYANGDSAVSVAVEDSDAGKAKWRNVSQSNLPLALTEADPSKVVVSGGDRKSVV